MKSIISILSIVSLIALAGCGGGGSGGGTDTSFDNTGASFNSDKSALAVGNTDDNVMVLTSNTITFQASDGNKVVLYYASGYPTKAIVGNDTDGYNVIVFGNWDTTNNTVDVGFVKSDGTISFERNVAVDATIMARLASLNTSISAGMSIDGAKFFDFELPDITAGEAWEFAGTAFSAGICGFAIGTAAASAGIGLPGVVIACGSTVITLATELDLIGTDNAAANASGTILTGIDVLGCAGANPVDCAGVAFTAGGVIIDYFDEQTVPIEDEARIAEGAVSSGFGDVKVTLTWDMTADLDLYVRDPNSVTISYTNPSPTDSNGRLDVDDLDGYGPENIFWGDGEAPSGTYTWWVNCYSGCGTANWRVLTLVNDELITYEGTLTSTGQDSPQKTFTF